MDLVFSNELILENIFSYLSTSDLLLRVNRTASKWNQIAKTMVEGKRKIILHDDNIKLYMDMINGGGTEHKVIHLEFEDSVVESITDEDELKIITLFSKIGKNVMELSVQSIIQRSFPRPVLIECLLQNCQKVKKISIMHPEIDDIPARIDLPEFKPLNSLTTLKMQNWNSFSVYCFFLRVAPNLREINLVGSQPVGLEDLLETEKQFPSFTEKIVGCRIYPNEESVDFLTSRNFNSLRKLKFKWDIKEEIFYDQILTHFAPQLVYLKIDMGLCFKGALHLLDLTLPFMKNLEILKLEHGYLSSKDKREREFGYCTFWQCEKDKREFPKLMTFQINFCYLINEITKEALEPIIKATFSKDFSHPIFPSVKVFHIDDMILEDFIQEMGADKKSRILNMLKNYFPNLSIFSETSDA